jgi:hypothetical protein
MKKIITVVVLCWIGVTAVRAQAVKMWRAELPGGNYDVALVMIDSVSTHEYIVDKGVKVLELTIATHSSVEGRFYYIEPLKPNAPNGIGQGVVDKVQEKVQEGAQRALGDNSDLLFNSVIKNYPTTTHAHTVEYRLQSRDEVNNMFKSVEAAWRNNTDTSYKP